MERTEAIDQIIELLDAPEGSTTNTSMRLPDTLRKAAALAVGALDMAPSATTVTADALRAELEHFVFRVALEEIYRDDPSLRPSLFDLALAMAQMDGSDLADDPAALRAAAAAVVTWRPDADADDVLAWAAGARWATA
ncbi:MAG: hypothetical protein JWO77_2793 [Ilumatobacteraceae bacterium]|nr:hypothetical protein [Ilumatobacteraceae bacterium]